MKQWWCGQALGKALMGRLCFSGGWGWKVEREEGERGEGEGIWVTSSALLNVWSSDSSMGGTWVLVEKVAVSRPCLRPTESEPLGWSPRGPGIPDASSSFEPSGLNKGHFFREAFLDFQSCLLGCKCFADL